MLTRSNATSLSFTISDDLLSTSSNLTSTQKTTFHPNPLPHHPTIDPHSFDDRPLPNRQNRQLLQLAKMAAYQQLNQNLYNPFQHKLSNTYTNKQSDLYHKEKQRQLELLSILLTNLEKKQLQFITNNNNYTILFHDPKINKNNLQIAGKNIISDVNIPTIADYYKLKFGTRSTSQPQTQNYTLNTQNNKKINNFINTNNKYQKYPQHTPTNHQYHQNNPNNKSINTPNIKYQQQQLSYKLIDNPSRQISTGQSHQSRNNHKPTSIQHNHNKKQYSYIKKQNKISQLKSSSNPFQKHPQQTKKLIPTKKSQQPPPLPPTNPNKKKKYSQVYQGYDLNLIQQLQHQLTSSPTTTFDDIAQLQTPKNLLQQAVLLPRLIPQFFQGIRKPMKGILLFGPPGTGKTLLAKAIAKDNIFFNVSASSLASKWKGDSQKMVRLLFQMAKYHSPSVIFFDEIDSLGSKRTQNQHDSTRKVKTQLLIQMDGVSSTSNQVFVLAATNRPWDLDEALRRRLQKRIYIPLPEAEGRKKMFDINLKGVNISENVNWNKLVELTKGCSGADISNVCRDAAYMPMRRKLTQIGGIGKLQQLKQNQLINEQVLESDLIEAAKKVKPSVGKDDLKRYECWMAEFGSS